MDLLLQTGNISYYMKYSMIINDQGIGSLGENVST